MMEKLKSRKFLTSAFAVIAGVFLALYGIMQDNVEVIITGGGMISVGALGYNVMEGFVDGKAAGAVQTVNTTAINASATDKAIVQKVLNPEPPEIAQ